MSRTAVSALLAGLMVLFTGLMVLAQAGLATAAPMNFYFVGPELYPDSYSVGGNFGATVDTDGATAIVGSRAGGAGLGSGSAFLYDAASASSLYKLAPDDGLAGDRFGDAVAVAGAYALVGANGSLVGNGAGSAYVFDVATGVQSWKLTADDGASGDSFGDAVDLAGSLALVGAPLSDAMGINSGAAYVFDVTTGTQSQKLVADDIGDFSQFGYSVSLDGTTALIGSRIDDGDPLGTGAAYLFNATTGDQLQKLTPPVATTGDRFGEAVALEAGMALVGAARGGGGPGAAYLYDAATGGLLQEFVPSDGAFGFNFGVSVALWDDIALIGASGAIVDGVVTGAVYAFDTASGQELGRFVDAFGAAGDNLGVAVAYQGGKAAFGTSFYSFYELRAGTAFLLEIGEIPEPSSALLMLTLVVGTTMRTARHG
ncbi:hypothetical protein Pla108_27460 [Botrimarina colliarenosi]|uniref:PEP-CTERM protein-sorting domain-containing protein n=1 Tax=Botrimarina colliarenosi TaxID=2528001 RepID=A0A5C6ABK1_9BACT|nr:FG-GAP repeat protein [Botrimarina colliarenosi]TWT96969.1 hypothetical protein Pla108_27460 [Botrimarina colliarenosi]